uniref:HesB/IscA family protein n=1 Tax=Algoriphagus sp. TaxID=1872435 RepID=UPI0040476614
MITVSDKAKERIIELKKEEGREDQENIRVSVKGGGCSGLMYELGFDAQVVDTDHVFEDKGVKILVDRKSLLYLAGTTLEFSDGLNGKGFQFVNPNASRTCGCGESFSV